MKYAKLGLFVASLLGALACGEPDDSALDGEGDVISAAEDEVSVEAHRRRGWRRGNGRDSDDKHDEGASRRDGGAKPGDRPDRGGDDDRGRDNERDAGTRPSDNDTPRNPTPTNPGSGPVIDVERDAGSPSNPGSGPVIDVDRNPPAGETINLPDGGVIHLDTSCPNYPTPLGVQAIGCCLPTGTCGLSSHLLDVPGLPKSCGGYDQVKMLDPTFNLPAKSCTSR